MSRWARLALGVAAIWPLLHIILFAALMVRWFFALGPDQAPVFPLFEAFPLVLTAHMLSVSATMVSMGTYTYLLFKNRALPSDQRVMWLVAVLMLPMLAMPAYWYVHVQRQSGDRGPHEAMVR